MLWGKNHFGKTVHPKVTQNKIYTHSIEINGMLPIT